MKTKTVLSPATVQEIKRMYAEVDGAGRRQHSQMAIAEHFGIGETTVYRAIKSAGGYRGHKEPMTELEMEKGAAASLQRLMLLNPELAAMSATNRMEADIAEKKAQDGIADTLVAELKREGNG